MFVVWLEFEFGGWSYLYACSIYSIWNFGMFSVSIAIYGFFCAASNSTSFFKSSIFSQRFAYINWVAFSQFLHLYGTFNNVHFQKLFLSVTKRLNKWYWRKKWFSFWMITNEHFFPQKIDQIAIYKLSGFFGWSGFKIYGIQIWCSRWFSSWMLDLSRKSVNLPPNAIYRFGI